MLAQSFVEPAVATKYWKQPPITDLPDRQWPSKRLSKAPIWLSTDLRDGNQALVSPMTFDQKWRFFRMLVAMGFKQIEISFPCASDTEYNFTRSVVETPGAVPDDVTLEVIAPCRKEALARAVDSVKGARSAIIFTFLATSDNYQQTIFQASEAELLQRARECTEYVRSITKDDPSAAMTKWSFGFGFEDFGNSRPEVALRLAETIKSAWGPTKENPIILGLATSVESFTPNVYADQVEYFSRNISNRETVCISLHTHNDRGGAVASAELGCLAGADRVEGCLFGNGERAGNLDLVTIGLNFFTQGIHPGLDFSRLDQIRQVYEEITQLSVHPRTPYSGDYYFRAFSGSHQDSIQKGLKKYSENPIWRIPYLPLDPSDVGRSFDCVIGINSQSGKSGVAWVLLQKLGLEVPKELAASFSKMVKSKSEELGGLTATDVCSLFDQTYSVIAVDGVVWLRRTQDNVLVAIDLSQYAEGSVGSTAKRFSHILRRDIRVTEEYGHELSSDISSDSRALYTKCEVEGVEGHVWGVGLGSSKVVYMRAILSALLTSRAVVLENSMEKEDIQLLSPVSLSPTGSVSS